MIRVALIVIPRRDRRARIGDPGARILRICRENRGGYFQRGLEILASKRSMGYVMLSQAAAFTLKNQGRRCSSSAAGARHGSASQRQNARSISPSSLATATAKGECKPLERSGDRQAAKPFTVMPSHRSMHQTHRRAWVSLT
jgi:hypothetical protein